MSSSSSIYLFIYLFMLAAIAICENKKIFECNLAVLGK